MTAIALPYSAIFSLGDGQHDLGKPTNRLGSIYATTYYGDGSNLSNLPPASVDVDGDYDWGGQHSFQEPVQIGSVEISDSGMYLGVGDFGIRMGGAGLQTYLGTDGAHIVAQRSFANEQRHRIYNTWTDASNNEYLEAGFDSDEAYLRTINNGTGASRILNVIAGSSLYFGSGGGLKWFIGTSGHLRPQLNASYDFGGTANRIRHVYADQYRSNGADPAELPEGFTVGPVTLIANDVGGSPSIADATLTVARFLDVVATEMRMPSALGMGGNNINWNVGNRDLTFEAGSGNVGSGQVHLDAATRLNWIFGVGGLIEQRNGTNAQAYRVYNTYTDATNYERLSVGFASNVALIATERDGTGVVRNLGLGTNGVARWTINSSGTLFPASTYNIGSSSSPAGQVFATTFHGDGSNPAEFPEGLRVDEGSSTVARLTDRQLQFEFGGNQSGLYRNSNNLVVRGLSTDILNFVTSGTILMRDAVRFGWSGSSVYGQFEAGWYKDAADTIAQRNGTNAQAHRIYNTYTDAANNEYVELGFDTNNAYLRTIANGTGVGRNLWLLPAGTAIVMGVGGVGGFLIDSTKFEPFSDTARSLGRAARRFNEVHAVTFHGDGSNLTNLPAASVDEAGDYNWTGTHDFANGLSVSSGTLTIQNERIENSSSDWMDFNGNGFGFYRNSDLHFRFNFISSQTTQGLTVRSNCGYHWSTSTSNAGTVAGASLWLDENYALAQRVGTNAQEYRLYGTYTDASNYERFVVRTQAAGSAQIGFESAGTGVDRDIEILMGASKTLKILGTGATKLDIGSNGTGAPELLMRGSKVLGYYSGGLQIAGRTLVGPTLNFTDVNAIIQTNLGGTVNFLAARGPSSGVAEVLIVNSHPSHPSDPSQPLLIRSDGSMAMAGDIDFTGLPTSDPAVAGRLWNDSGTVKISAG